MLLGRSHNKLPMKTPPTIYTIGHSTHPLEEFIEMLKSFDIKVLADIRKLPGSRKYPQFDRQNLEISMPENDIEYRYFEGLGGRRKQNKDSKNTKWRNASFRAYADYMETEEFRNAVEDLKEIAREKPVAYMCSEAVWWRCHRSMVSDFLKAEGWNVQHIMAAGKSQAHPYTQPAEIIDGKLTYGSDDGAGAK